MNTNDIKDTIERRYLNTLQKLKFSEFSTDANSYHTRLCEIIDIMYECEFIREEKKNDRLKHVHSLFYHIRRK